MRTNAKISTTRRGSFLKAAEGLSTSRLTTIVNRFAKSSTYRGVGLNAMADAYAKDKEPDDFRPGLLEALKAEPRKEKLTAPAPETRKPALVVQPGKTYRLTEDVQNANPDLRKTAAVYHPVIPAGTWVVGDVECPGAFEIKGELDAVRSRGQHADLWARIVAVLEPVETFKTLLSELYILERVTAADLLADLYAAGLVTQAGLREQAKTVRAARVEAARIARGTSDA
mgnify:CR=1 FL=1